VRSISINEDGKEVLIPTVVNGKVVSNAEAIAEYRRTGRHLGKFDSAKAANAYAEALHQREAERVTAAPPTSRPAAAPTAPAAPKANTARSIAEDMQNDRVKKGGKWSLPVDRIVQLSPAEAKTFYKWSREFGPGRIAPIIFSNGTLQLGVIDTDGKRHSLPKKTELDKEPSDAIIRRVKEIANGDDAVAFDILQEMGY
jgi:hypothetical protein